MRGLKKVPVEQQGQRFLSALLTAAVGTGRFHSPWRLKLSATRRWPASILGGNSICLASQASFCASSSWLICCGGGSAVQQSDGSVSSPRTRTDPLRSTGKYLPPQQRQVQLLKSTTCPFACLLPQQLIQQRMKWLHIYIYLGVYARLWRFYTPTVKPLCVASPTKSFNKHLRGAELHAYGWQQYAPAPVDATAALQLN